MTSLTIENYLKAVFKICTQQEKRRATTGELADSLQVSPGTVTSMLKSLSDAGLAAYTPYEGVSLTEAGRLLALRVLRRHRLIELFLTRTLDLPWDQVHDEAENMEHAVSDLLVDRIDRFLGFPTSDPHGDPIPKADGTLDTTVGHKLSHWPIGVPFRLMRVLDQSPEFLRYLSDAGLRLETHGKIASFRREAGILTLVIGDKETPFSHEAADKLLVAAI